MGAVAFCPYGDSSPTSRLELEKDSIHMLSPCVKIGIPWAMGRTLDGLNPSPICAGKGKKTAARAALEQGKAARISIRQMSGANLRFTS